MEKSSKSINKNLEKIEAKIIQYCNIEDVHLKTIIEDYKKED